MKQDRFLTGILIGIAVLVVIALAVPGENVPYTYNLFRTTIYLCPLRSISAERRWEQKVLFIRERWIFAL